MSLRNNNRTHTHGSPEKLQNHLHPENDMLFEYPHGQTMTKQVLSSDSGWSLYHDSWPEALRIFIPNAPWCWNMYQIDPNCTNIYPMCTSISVFFPHQIPTKRESGWKLNISISVSPSWGPQAFGRLLRDRLFRCLRSADIKIAAPKKIEKSNPTHVS